MEEVLFQTRFFSAIKSRMIAIIHPIQTREFTHIRVRSI